MSQSPDAGKNFSTDGYGRYRPTNLCLNPLMRGRIFQRAGYRHRFFHTSLNPLMRGRIFQPLPLRYHERGEESQSPDAGKNFSTTTLASLLAKRGVSQSPDAGKNFSTIDTCILPVQKLSLNPLMRGRIFQRLIVLGCRCDHVSIP